MVKHDDYMTPYKAWADICKYLPRDRKVWEAFHGNSVLMWCVKMRTFLRVPSGIVSSPIPPFLFSRRSLKGCVL
jgi:hypothetical protein